MSKPNSRRKFIATGILTLTGASIGLAENIKGKTLVHHVFFWLKNPSSSQDLEKLIEGIETLRKIDTIKLIKIGLPANTPKRDVIDNSYSISLLTMFDSVKGHDVYQEHPVHLNFVEKYSHLWQKVVVYDSTDI